MHVDWGESWRQCQRAYTTLRAPALTVNAYTLALDYIERNGGCAFMPKRAVKDLLDSGQLHQIRTLPSLNILSTWFAQAHPMTQSWWILLKLV